MIITKHAKSRIVERAPHVQNFDEAKRCARIAWTSGETISQIARTNEDLAQYMRKKKAKNGNEAKVRFYKENIYIWRGKKNRLVTAHPVPERFLKEVQE